MEAADWLADKAVAMVGADTWGMEAVPKADGVSAFPVHQEFLVRCGIFIMENVATEELAADGVYEFAFSFAPMKIKGQRAFQVTQLQSAKPYLVHEAR